MRSREENDMRSIRDALDEVGTTLAAQGMPQDEVRKVLGADDPVIVRRHLELHRERLSEQLEDRQRAVDHVERVLVDGVARARAS
jgi:hypothetical protein